MSGLLDRGMLRAKDVAKLLGLSRSSVYHMAREGRLPYYRCGDTDRSPMLFRPDDIEDYLKRRRGRKAQPRREADDIVAGLVMMATRRSA